MAQVISWPKVILNSSFYGNKTYAQPTVFREKANSKQKQRNKRNKFTKFEREKYKTKRMPKKMNDNNIKTFFSYPSFPSSPTAGGAIVLSAARRRLGSGHREFTLDSDVSRMLGNQNGGLLEEFLIILGLIAVQVINALYVVTLSPILSSGVKPLFLIIFACMATCIFVLPFAIAFERWRSI